MVYRRLTLYQLYPGLLHKLVLAKTGKGFTFSPFSRGQDLHKKA